MKSKKDNLTYYNAVSSETFKLQHFCLGAVIKELQTLKITRLVTRNPVSYQELSYTDSAIYSQMRIPWN
jgi:hypothetical protein